MKLVNGPPLVNWIVDHAARAITKRNDVRHDIVDSATKKEEVVSGSADAEPRIQTVWIVWTNYKLVFFL